MKESELKALFEKAKVEKVDDREVATLRVYVKKLNREFYVETKKEDEARKTALDLVLNESDRIRGFELEKDN